MTLRHGFDEGPEERVRREGLRPELGVELRGHEERVLGKLHDLGQMPVGRVSGEHQAGCLESLAVLVVELVAVTVALVDGKVNPAVAFSSVGQGPSGLRG